MRSVRYASCVCVLALAAALGSAAPPKLDVPPELKPVDGYVTYSPPADVFSAVYVSKDGLSPFPAAFLKDSRSLVLPTKGEKPGRYGFTLVASNDKGEQARADFVVVIGDAPAPPGPIPPDPPKPPLSPLAKSLADAFATETAPDRRERLAALIEVMAAAVGLADSGSYADTAALAAEVTKRRTAAVGDALPAVRKAIGGHLNTALGTAVLTLDSANKAKVMTAYADVASALREVLK